MEIGLDTFGDITPDPHSGRAVSPAERYRDIIALAKLAEDAGFALFGAGEHHRLDIPVSSPAVLLAAIAGATRRIRLASTVTILTTLDPVRVYQDFATLDLASGGRAAIIAGRGAFFESFALFGHDTADYDALFDEHLDLLLKLRAAERVTWSGRFRPPLADAAISPRALQDPLPVWLGVGGNPESPIRAGRLGLPVILANISKPPAGFADQIRAYREAGAAAGFPPERLKVGIGSHLYCDADGAKARDEFYPYYSAYFLDHAPRTNYAAEVPRAVYDERVAPKGPTFVGSPEEIVDKLGYERELFRNDLFLGHFDIGGQPFAMAARTIELVGARVIPVVKDW
ncbi:MAG TPA: LLM class flavin-dependent oxidoreductase [Bauldia sp.]|nr:LLM class flavin-dependent oxidoreductase [Bauldia sp.]